MKEYKLNLPANASQRIHVKGNGFWVKNPGAVTIRIDANNNQFYLQKGQGVMNLPYVFEELHIQNTTGAAIEAVVMVGMGQYVDNSLTGDFVEKANGSFTGLPKLTISGAIQTIAANANRVKLGIMAADGNAGVIWVGGVADEGFPLAAGDYQELKITSALDVIGTNVGDFLYIGEIE